MGTTPTLQSLALYAQEHFAEDSSSFDDRVSSTLDMVVETYAAEPDPEDVCGHARNLICEGLERQGKPVDQGDVDAFVRGAVTYLQAVYPDGEAVREDEEQQLLSRLFSAHLVQASVAARGY